MEKLADGLFWYAAFLFSVVCHEAAHAFVAFKLGDRTAYEGGQVTMNPIPHIRREPVGTILIPILSFLIGGWMLGWASAPYNPHWASRYPKRSALMALAGPTTNLILFILMFFFIRVGVAAEVFFPPEVLNASNLVESYKPGIFSAIAKFISILFSLNLILFIFNLLPLPPLDGSGIVPLALHESTARRYLDFVRNPTFSLIGLLVAWKLFDHIFTPIFFTTIKYLYPGVTYG
jgi:Zn-dependent protease